VTTTARRDGDEWVVSGMKYYISGIDHCDHFLLVARTGTDERTGRGQLTLFIVDDPHAAGISTQVIATALQAPERQFTVYLDGLRLPADSVVGEVGHGLRALFDALNPERVLSAVICTGVGRYALDKAVAYAKERSVWGVPIGSHQGVQHPLAEAAIELEAARGMTWRAAALFDAGLPAGEEANMAKFLASRSGMKALDTAIQTHGGNGLALEFGLADLWSIVRLQQIAPVSTQMVLNHVAQHTLGLPRSY
jgi:alkylation response protein AidB-like acyl-CoA dehydrogenase